MKLILLKRLFHSLLILSILTLSTISSFSLGNDDLILAENGKTDFVIILPIDATPVQKSAANELQTTLKQMTEVDFPIQTETELNANSEMKQFVIGPSQTSKILLGNEIDEATLGYDSILLKRIGNSIILSGHPKRGPLYSVNTFLEDQLGCRYWTSAEYFIPKKEKLTVSKIDQVFTPKLEYRESFYRDSFNGPFAVKMKCNGNSNNISEELGGHHQFCFFVHSFHWLIPEEKYFLDHPDWFCEIDGVRKVGYPDWANPSSETKAFLEKLKPEQIHASGTQLCLSNEEMRKELVKNALARLESSPKASFISISQNDWHGYCRCEQCSKVAEEEESQAGPLIRFVNKVAEDIEKVRPDIYVETLAYQYTRKPPKLTKPRDNVVVRLCSIECSFSQTLNEGEQNRTFKEDMEGWSKIAKNLFVWDYMTDFALYLLPFPNYRVLSSNINFYVDHHTIGLFEQGDYHCVTGDFVQLRNWIVSKMLWNPDLDQGELMDEFISGYYAPEFVPIYREYFDLLSDRVEESGIHLGIFKTSTLDWMNLETMNRATELQNQAVELAHKLEKKDPQKYDGLVHKVWRERIPLDLVWLQDYNRYKMESRLSGKPFKGPEKPKTFAEDFAKRLDSCGLTQHKEWVGPNDFNIFKQDLIDRNSDVETNEMIQDCVKDIPENCWIAIQEFDMNKSKLGEWTFIVEDSAAVNGKAIKMPGSHFEWAVSWNVNRFLPMLKSSTGNDELPPQFHLYAFVRCDAQTNEGSAMTMGVYDSEAKKGIVHKDIPVSDISGSEYKMIDLGVLPLKETQYFWAAPPKRPDEVEAVFVDQILLIRE
ncbi:MAG: DUF4838 domain-containing protein [Planctomycetia bacterium]|nr:DUF4838 domain-containing protein [Planctomycetia bacterium]